MTDPRLARYAHLICEHSLGIGESHRLHIGSLREGSPLAVATAREAWRRGARVSVGMQPDWALGDLLRYGSDDQVAYLDPAELESVERFDRWLFVWTGVNSAERAGVASARDTALTRAHAPWMARHDEREAAGELRWVGAAYPTALGAQTARMGTAAWERFVFAALLLDEPDPIAAWRARAAHHRHRHRPAHRRGRAGLGVVRRGGQSARRRGLLCAAAVRGAGRDHVRRAVAAQRP
jgi:aminopeptidase